MCVFYPLVDCRRDNWVQITCGSCCTPTPSVYMSSVQFLSQWVRDIGKNCGRFAKQKLVIRSAYSAFILIKSENMAEQLYGRTLPRARLGDDGRYRWVSRFTETRINTPWRHTRHYTLCHFIACTACRSTKTSHASQNKVVNTLSSLVKSLPAIQNTMWKTK